jgi:hypothetical protein
VGVLEIGYDPDLTEESVGTERGGKLGAENLERDLALVPQVAGEVDGGHATLSQFPLQLVSVSQRRTKAAVGLKLVQ